MIEELVDEVGVLVSEYIELSMRVEIENTDWDQTDVLIISVPIPELGDSLIPEIKADRFEGSVPRDYQYEPRSQVYTITEALLDRVEEEYDKTIRH